MATHWTRDFTRGPRIPLEHVIHRRTRQTAELYGLRDRGLLAPGMRADLNVIDYEALTFGKPRMAWDLRGGAPRLVQKASGYRHPLRAVSTPRLTTSSPESCRDVSYTARADEAAGPPGERWPAGSG